MTSTPFETIGRPVRVVSLSFPPTQDIARIAAVVDAEGARGTDVIVLPEVWQGEDVWDTLEGPAVSTMAMMARKHRMYLVCPILRREGRRAFNSAVWLDRRGRVAGWYDKAYPFWGELQKEPTVGFGETAVVFDSDFGRVGMATCFDVNFPPLWQALADRGAELILWNSAYSAGRSLQAHAINHNYYIVSATLKGTCLVYDITGECIRCDRGAGIHVARVTLDLDRGIFHYDYNIEQRDRLLADHCDDVELEQDLTMESWFVLRARRPGVSVRALAKAYGIEDLRDYKRRSRRELDRLRGKPVQ